MKKLFSRLAVQKIIKIVKPILYISPFLLVIQFVNRYMPNLAWSCYDCNPEMGKIETIIIDLIQPAFFPLSALIALLLLFFFSPLIVWLIFLFIFLFLWPLDFLPVYLIFVSILIGFFLLRLALSFLFFKAVKKLKLLPKISETERVALQVGETWLEKEFFTGRPNFKTFLEQKTPVLSKEERDFLDNPTEELCSLSTEWDFLQRKKLTHKEEEFIKKGKFFGLNIPREYEGLGFSPFAHAKVIEKLASHNIPLSIIAMVPNSLGPAELLLKYGTEKQKNQYLSSLASAQLWPCFGLTEAQAGSDASSIQSEGILFKEGEELKIRLNFEKRWITLSAKADLIGLAVRLKDPDQLYSEKTDLGITCVLLTSNLKGIERGFYHDPMGLPIYNAPIKGKDVIVSAETAIIGGLKQAGQGWKMLMESLSMGRSISLPALSLACGKRVSWLTGTYAFVRKQFGLPIGKFSAIQEKLAAIVGLTHLMNVTHTFTLSGLNQGIVSPVVSAFTKYQLTELVQKVVKQGMDIMGGAGLSLGPKNKIALLHTALPLAVTVEGANTLSRTLIVYGQGLLKTHPQAYAIIQALENNNLKIFHKNFWIFLYQTLCHFVRSCVFTLTRACLAQPVFFIRNLVEFFHNKLSLKFSSFMKIPLLSSFLKIPLLPSFLKIPLLPSFLKIPLLSSFLKIPLLPSFLKIPLLPSFLKIPLLPSFLKIPLLPSFLKIPLLSSFLKIPLLPSFLKIPLLPSFLRKQESLRKNKKQNRYRGARYLQKLSWSASLFAFLSNLNLLLLGGKLKTKGQFNGRFADWLSFQYMISAVLWQNRNGSDSWLVSQWTLDYCFLQIQNNVMDILNNYPVAVIRWFLKPLVWTLRLNPLGLKPSDKLDKKLADRLLEDKEFKQKLCDNMYFSKDEEDQFQKLKLAYDLSLKEREILNKIKHSFLNFETDNQTNKSVDQNYKLDSYSFEIRHFQNTSPSRESGDIQDQVKKTSRHSLFKANKINFELCREALKQAVISQKEFDTLQLAQKAQWDAVQVDAFKDTLCNSESDKKQ